MLDENYGLCAAATATTSEMIYNLKKRLRSDHD